MDRTERDEKRDTTLENDAEREDESNSKHKAPFMPDSEDDSPLGSTDRIPTPEMAGLCDRCGRAAPAPRSHENPLAGLPRRLRSL